MYISTKTRDDAYSDILKYYTHKLRVGICMSLEGNMHLKSGVGKSYTGIRTGEIMDKDYLNYDGDHYSRAIKKIAWTPKDFKRAMKELESVQRIGQVIMVDEAGILVNRKKWFSFINQAISDTVMTMRQLRGIAIFVTPSVWKIEKDIREYVTLLGTCFKELTTNTYTGGGDVGTPRIRVDLRRCYWDDQRNKVYRFHPKLYVSDEQRILQFYSFMPPLPRNKKLVADYEEKATEYKQKARKVIEDMSAEELEANDIINEVLENPDKYIKKNVNRVTHNSIRFNFNVSADYARYVVDMVNDKLREHGHIGGEEEKQEGGKNAKVEQPANVQP